MCNERRRWARPPCEQASVLNRYGLAWVRLALAACVGLPIQAARAQTIAVFGVQTCQAWLAEPETGGLGRYWVLGGWSGLNLGSLLRHDRTDTGRTLMAADVLAAVRGICAGQPAMSLSEATTRAWARAKAGGQ